MEFIRHTLQIFCAVVSIFTVVFLLINLGMWFFNIHPAIGAIYVILVFSMVIAAMKTV